MALWVLFRGFWPSVCSLLGVQVLDHLSYRQYLKLWILGPIRVDIEFLYRDSIKLKSLLYGFSLATAPEVPHVGQLVPRYTRSLTRNIWGFPKIRGPLLGSPYHKSPTILGSIVGPLIFGISHLLLGGGWCLISEARTTWEPHHMWLCVAMIPNPELGPILVRSQQ